jgi:hypothetical protein
MRALVTWVGLAAIVATVAAALASPWLGRRDDAAVRRAVALQALLGLVFFASFPFAREAEGHRATWFFVAGPATVLLWASALGFALWSTWRRPDRS